MSYNANQYNYATPLSSVDTLTAEQSTISDKKYFSLFDNVLDGSYFPIDGSVGLWGTALSDANGVLSAPYNISVNESLSINAFRITGSQYSYPVAFTVKFYNESVLLYTLTETANDQAERIYYLSKTLVVTRYDISISKISQTNAPVRLYNLYNPGYVKRSDNVIVNDVELSDASSVITIASVDAFAIRHFMQPTILENVVNALDVSIINTQEAIAGTVSTDTTDTLHVRHDQFVGFTSTSVTDDTLRARITPHSEQQGTLSGADVTNINVSEFADYTNIVDGVNALPIDYSHENTYNFSTNSQDYVVSKLLEVTEQTNIIDVTHDALRVKPRDISWIIKTLGVSTDTLNANLSYADVSSITNFIEAIKDTCPINITSHILAELINIHSVMKQPSRHIYGKVYITYTDPMISSSTLLADSGSAYNSNTDQVIDGEYDVNARFFTLYDNDLSGDYILCDENSQVGWVSAQVSNDNGEFDGYAPYLRLSFSERPINSLQIVFDSSHGATARDFSVEYIQSNGNTFVRAIVDNDEASVNLTDEVANVTDIVITVTRVSKPGYPAAIIEVPTLSTYLYVGYQDRSDLVSIDLLEELTYDDNIEALGGISANEVSVILDNSDGDFYFNNTSSTVASSLRNNRKIEPWLGVEITEGDIEWYSLGTFWSYKWDVPVEGLVAKVVGFDTIGLLDKTEFKEHHTQVGKSIGQLIEYVLSDAKKTLDFISWSIDEALYDIVIPYAWFEVASHTAALRKISQCYPMHVYCDRSGAICASPQKLHMDFYYDTWSDSTNVISKNYSSLYTTLPNIISVEVKNPKVTPSSQLVDDSLTFDVAYISYRTLNFNAPYLSDIEVNVVCDPTVRYTYNVYSWGIEFEFTGTGIVSNISCVGTALDITYTSTIAGRNDQSIRTNGAVRRDVRSDFIQDSNLAGMLINRILSLSEHDKFDVDVEYRGDISLTINDPILLLDGIAPDNRYNIRRHELYWNGSLSGSAHLNT